MRQRPVAPRKRPGYATTAPGGGLALLDVPRRRGHRTKDKAESRGRHLARGRRTPGGRGAACGAAPAPYRPVLTGSDRC
ncbi:hypothetical protein SSP531S_19790 [Streptomyces spongiicola]|uniref:Uncharacterized protein n=1 Tax=Streptomyces spongiicola TaxID=1690221 RepID=A0A388SXG7_9ACTN|nr:hypothetical protein SSP531S_19790 [Streptomyces spongiicola]